MEKKKDLLMAEFFEKLSQRPNTSTSFNPYLDSKVLNNLRVYLEFLVEQREKGRGEIPMLVGEAPGYQGCRITGLPFTSSHQLMESRHPIIKKLRKNFHFDSLRKEPTATIMWEFIDPQALPPLFWNAFPFHPFKEGEVESNRAPSTEEVEEGVFYLEKLISLFEPKVIYAVGRKSEETLAKNFPQIPSTYIRHPSNGGKTQFLAGLYAEGVPSWDFDKYLNGKKAA